MMIYRIKSMDCLTFRIKWPGWLRIRINLWLIADSPHQISDLLIFRIKFGFDAENQ
jgi:hypothetical protein